MLAERVQLVPMQRGSSVLSMGSSATRAESLGYLPRATRMFLQGQVGKPLKLQEHPKIAIT